MFTHVGDIKEYLAGLENYQLRKLGREIVADEEKGCGFTSNNNDVSMRSMIDQLNDSGMSYNPAIVIQMLVKDEIVKRFSQKQE